MRCRSPAEPGRKVCRKHGGLTPRGPASPHWKHGRRSRYPLPERLIDRYERGVTDPELLDLSHEIALVDTRSAELVGKLGTGESGAAWAEARAALELLQSGVSTSDNGTIQDGITALEAAIMAGERDFGLWANLMAFIEQRRKLVESEQKRRVAIEQNINVQDMVVITQQIVNIITRNVTDRPALERISAEIKMLLNQGSPTETG